MDLYQFLYEGAIHLDPKRITEIIIQLRKIIKSNNHSINELKKDDKPIKTNALKKFKTIQRSFENISSEEYKAGEKFWKDFNKRIVKVEDIMEDIDEAESNDEAISLYKEANSLLESYINNYNLHLAGALDPNSQN